VTRSWIAGAALCTLASKLLGAQAVDNATQKTFYTPRDGVIAAGFLAASAGLSIFDPPIAHFFRDTSLFHVRTGEKLSNYATHINESTLTVGGLGVWAIARLFKAPTVADIAFHGAESVAAASLTSQVIRGPLGRTRPLDAAHPYDDQYEFHFLQGFTHFEQRSFPSIHSASGFAFASALIAETKLRAPHATWYVAVPAYALAMTPGLSRMYLGQHWASDIFAGAFAGTFYGWRIVDYSHAHTKTPVDRIFLGSVSHVQFGSDHNGTLIGWTTRF
jgi:membrane-associated phospholipid phosphatase